MLDSEDRDVDVAGTRVLRDRGEKRRGVHHLPDGRLSSYLISQVGAPHHSGLLLLQPALSLRRTRSSQRVHCEGVRSVRGQESRVEEVVLSCAVAVDEDGW